jgi:hypothetical protein
MILVINNCLAMPMKKISILLFAFTLLSGCSKSIFNRNKQTLLYSELRNMWIEKQEYFLGDTIRLYFKENHPGELGVKTPSDNFFYLIYTPTLSTIPGVKSMLPHHHFKKVNILEIIPATTKANPHDTRFTGNQLIFTESGIYTFLLSENLSTDAFGPAETLTLRYNHTHRKPGA